MTRLRRYRRTVRRSARYLLLGAVISVGALSFSSELLAIGLNFRVHEPPAFMTSPRGNWDSGEMDIGGVAYHNGQFHSIYNGLERYPMEYSFGYATSEDGTQWERVSDTPVLTLEDTGLDGANIAANSLIVEDDGSWTLYFTLAPANNNYIGSIWRATADSPFGPWTVGEEPVLAPGPDGDWDSRIVGHASVVRDGDGYRMYYTGAAPIRGEVFSEEHAHIGLAYSDDGITWERHNDPSTTEAPFAASDPVFAPDTSDGAWDHWHVTDANVQEAEGYWIMMYRGGATRDRGDIGMATSEDGITWHRTFDEPILTSRDINARGIWFTNYLRHEEQDLIWLEAGWIDNVSIHLLSRP